ADAAGQRGQGSLRRACRRTGGDSLPAAGRDAHGPSNPRRPAAHALRAAATVRGLAVDPGRAEPYAPPSAEGTRDAISPRRRRRGAGGEPMSDGKRPGGLTALAVLNFVFGGLGALGLLAIFAVLGAAQHDATAAEATNPL